MNLPAPLDARRIRAALAGHVIGAGVELHEELSSTSDHLRILGESGHSHGTVVFAESQTAGRGRRDNKWSAEPRRDLLLSILLRPEVAPEKFPRLATLAALGLCKAVETSCNLAPQIKWPNDLLLGGKKFCGILTEMFAPPQGTFIVLGIGMNVNTLAFSPELAGRATSLCLENDGRELDRTLLAITLLRQIGVALGAWDRGFPDAIAETRRRSFLIGKRLRALVNGFSIEGVGADLDSEGCLVIRREDGALHALQSVEQVRAI